MSFGFQHVGENHFTVIFVNILGAFFMILLARRRAWSWKGIFSQTISIC